MADTLTARTAAEEKEPVVAWVDEEGDAQPNIIIPTTEAADAPPQEPAAPKTEDEKRAEGTTDPAKPAEPAKQEAAKADAPEPPPATVTPPAAPTPAPASEPIDPYEALGISKEDTLGRKLIEAHKAGDLQNFLKAFGTDWDKMPDTDVVRQSIESKYKDLDAEDRAYMVKRDMAKYDTSSFDEDEARAVRIQLKLEAKAIRDGYKAEQASYKVPDRSQPSPEELQRQQQEQDRQTEWTQIILSDPYLTEFESNKVVKVGDGEDKFNYAVPNLDLKKALDTPFDEHFVVRDKDGKAIKFKHAERAEALAFVLNKEAFIKELAEHYMMLGEKRKDAKLRNLATGKETPAPQGDAPAVKWGGE